MQLITTAGACVDMLGQTRADHTEETHGRREPDDGGGDRSIHADAVEGIGRKAAAKAEDVIRSVAVGASMCLQLLRRPKGGANQAKGGSPEGPCLTSPFGWRAARRQPPVGHCGDGKLPLLLFVLNG